jgi:hypothetical protein
VQQRNPTVDWTNIGPIGQPAPQPADEFFISLDKDQSIVGPHVLNDPRRDGTRAGAHFEDSSPGQLNFSIGRFSPLLPLANKVA